MASFLADANFPLPAVQELRRLGRDVLTLSDAGRANQSIPDDAVLAPATDGGRALLTLNRRHFVRLHREGASHAGIVACTSDPDSAGLAARIHAEAASLPQLAGELIRVNRPQK